MNELKKADEIVRALRDYASDCDSDSEYCFQCTFACVCDKFDNNAPKIIADLIDNLTAQLAAVTAERDAAANAVARMAEYIVTLGGVDYHLCDVIPQEHHLKYQPKNDGDYDNEPCIECVKAYFMSGAGKEQNDGK